MTQRAKVISAAPTPLDGVDCVGYCRVSTERQAGEVFTSLADQRAAITALATRLGTVVGRWYADEGVSGATATERPAFSRMLAECVASPRAVRTPGLVLVLNDSRFGRFPDPDEAAALRFAFSRVGWRVRFCESDETEDPTYRGVIRAIGSAQASEYRRNIQRNAKRGAKGAAEQGFWTSRAPIGYRRKVVYPSGRERVLDALTPKAPDEKIALTPGPDDEVALVRYAFDAYARASGDGVTLGTLSRAICARWPAHPVSLPSLREILKNPAYVGDVVSGRRPSDKAERALHYTRPTSEWYGKRDAHPALVTRDLFAAVQRRLAENRAKPRAATSAAALSGVLTCAICGSPLVSGGHHGAGDRQVKTGVYRCRDDVVARGSPANARRCTGRGGSIVRWAVDEAVVDLVAAEVERPERRAVIIAAIDARIAAIRTTSLPGLIAERARQRLADATAQRDRLVQAIARGTLSHDEATTPLAEIRREVAAAETELARADAVAASAAASIDRLEQHRQRLLALTQSFRTVAQAATGPDLRALLRPWVASATFHKVTRLLTVTICQVPSVPGLGVCSDSMAAGASAPS